MFPSTRRVPQQSSRTLFSGAVILLLLATGAAFASDAPARRAARLSFVSGSVSVDKSDNTSTLAGQLNMPIAEGQRVTTGDEGQAEIEFEDGSLLRLTPHTSITVSALGFDSNGNSQTQLVLLHGLTYAELRATTRFQYTIDAGGDIISPVENSTIRVNLDEPPAAIAVLDGMAHVEQSGATGGPGFHTDVKAGETLRADIADSALYFLTQQIAEDSWDQWNEARDQAAADAAAARTAARDSYAGDAGYGWSDLDANGTWYNVPGYGQVWQPGVAAGSDFDPYGYGNWVWYSGSGYLVCLRLSLGLDALSLRKLVLLANLRLGLGPHRGLWRTWLRRLRLCRRRQLPLQHRARPPGLPFPQAPRRRPRPRASHRPGP